MLLSVEAWAFTPTPPFITVDEYVSLHPEQKTLMTSFEKLVSAPSEPLTSPQPTPVKIAVVYPGIQVSDYWRRSVSSFKARMNAIGLKFEMMEYFSQPSAKDHQLQTEHLQDALKNDPDYLIFTLDVFQHKAELQKILKKGRPKIILQNMTTPVRDWEGIHPLLYVGFDHTIGAQLLADYYVEKTAGYGDYGILYFPRGYVSTMRGDTFHRDIASSSALELKSAIYTDSTMESGRQATLQILLNPQIQFIYASSTDIALGAIQALKETNKLGKVMINGWGGGSPELEAILKGEMDVTVMRMNDDNGVAMAEAIRLDVEGKTNQVPTIYSGEMVIVELGITKKALEKLVKRAFRYSGE